MISVQKLITNYLSRGTFIESSSRIFKSPRSADPSSSPTKASPVLILLHRLPRKRVRTRVCYGCRRCVHNWKLIYYVFVSIASMLRTTGYIYTHKQVTVVCCHIGWSNGNNPSCPSHACHVVIFRLGISKTNVSVIMCYYSGACESLFSRVTKVRYGLHFSDQFEI